MRWVPAAEGGYSLGYLTQKIIDPVSAPPEVTLIEEAQEERENDSLPRARRILLHAGR